MLDLFIGLGSNLGDRAGNLARAREALQAHYALVAASPIYETPALMPEGAPDDWNIAFLNQVIHLHAQAPAHDVLRMVKDAERAIGRAPAERWAPRMIDMDIIAYGDTLIEEDELSIPHAQMHLRDFVVVPFSDIAPNWCLPKGHTLAGVSMAALRAQLPKVDVKPYVAQ